MFDGHRRPVGRLFYLLAFLLVWLGVSRGQTLPTTTISEGLFAAQGPKRKMRRCHLYPPLYSSAMP
jgi:hypothetical protein